MKEYLTSVRTGLTIERDYIPSPNEPMPPTPDEAAAKALAAWRATRVLPRAQFCTALLRAGLLTPPEAIAAAAGATPQPLEDAITLLPETDRDEARILWAGLTEVQRSHPLIELVAWANDMTAEQVDAIFGWQA